MDKFTKAYIECALWSSAHSESMDASLESCGYDVSDIAPEALTSIESDCTDFQTANATLLENIDSEQAGHDFWLTRNGHGTGFWDRGLGEIGTKLTDAAHVYGNCDLYVGDDDKIYAS